MQRQNHTFNSIIKIRLLESVLNPFVKGIGSVKLSFKILLLFFFFMYMFSVFIHSFFIHFRVYSLSVFMYI